MHPVIEDAVLPAEQDIHWDIQLVIARDEGEARDVLPMFERQRQGEARMR